jgi:hypothetical protein
MSISGEKGRNQLDDHENRNMPIIDLVDIGDPALPQNMEVAPALGKGAGSQIPVSPVTLLNGTSFDETRASKLELRD